MARNEKIPTLSAESPPRRFPYCGALSIAAPFIGYVALDLSAIRHWDYRLFLDGGPTWLQKIAYTIMGTAGLVGLVLGCIAWYRFENRALAVFGLLLNGPLIFLLIDGLPTFLQVLPELLDPAKRKILPAAG
jgi:hypothetical protein